MLQTCVSLLKTMLQGSFADAVKMTSTRQENLQSWKEGKN